MARRTVLHLIDTGGPGGAETIFLNLVSRIDPERWRSVAVVPVKDWLWHALREHDIEPVLLPSNGAFDRTYLLGIAALARRHKADLIQTHLFTSAVYASAAAIPSRLPVVCTFHGHNDVPQSERYGAAKYWIINRRRNHYVFVSDSLRNWFLRSTPLPATRSHVIHNGIDTELFRPRRDDTLRGELGAEPSDFLVGAVGNLRRPKDYPTFLRSAALLSRKSPRYRFVIVGAEDPRIGDELRQLASELDLNSRLTFAGFRNDAQRVMNALDVYVLSSSSEGFSLTTTQAMASGIPVVSTRSGGPEEILKHGETGVLVPIGSPDAIADAVDELRHNEALRGAFSVAGRRRVLDCFSIDGMVAKYDRIYHASLRKRVVVGEPVTGQPQEEN